MTNKEILAMNEQEFNSYIHTESNKAIDKTLLNKKNELEVQKETLKQSITTLTDEANVAFDTYDTQIANEKGIQIDQSENKIMTIDKTIQRLLETNESLIIIDRSRLEELDALVEAYYRDKLAAATTAFNEQVQALVPLQAEAERLNKVRGTLLQSSHSMRGLYYSPLNDFLSVDKRDSLTTLLRG